MNVLLKPYLLVRALAFASVLVVCLSHISSALGQRAGRSHADSVLAIADEVLHQIPSGIKIEPTKCLTALMFEAYQIRHERKMPPNAQSDNISNQVTMVSPQGHFTIYYDTSGTSACLTDYAQSVARTADSAFEFEINVLKYPKPPFTDSDSTFHLHILNQQNGIYGFTVPTDNGALGRSPSGKVKHRTFIVIDDDFSEAFYPTHGHDAMHVTVFHEFQHVIQYGIYGVAEDQSDDYFKELTSVWMETRSYPEVKDYIQYPGAYFSTIDLSFYGSFQRGYGEGIWFQFLEKRYGDQIIQQIWQQNSLLQPDPVFAMQDVLAKRGSSFCTEYMRFGNALFFTGRRFTGASIFPDARLFPVDSLKTRLILPGVGTAIPFGAVVASINYFYTGFGQDTVAVTVARDTNRSVISDGSVTITGPRTYSATYQHPESFCDTIGGYSPTSALAFPQPFIIGGQVDSVSILASNAGRAPVSVELDIYGINMQQIAHIEQRAQAFTGEYYVSWSGRDDAGRLVPSGIYLYTVNTDGNRRVGKLAVIRATPQIRFDNSGNTSR